MNKKNFIILFSIFYTLGITCVFFTSENFKFIIFYAFLIFLVLSLLILFSKIDFKKALVLYFIFLIGVLRANNAFRTNDVLENIRANNVELQGQVDSNKNIVTKTNRVKFYINVNQVYIFNKEFKNINSRVLVNLDLTNDIETKILIGDYIKVKGKLRPPKNAKNPYQFDYKKYLFYNDCSNILYGETESFEKISGPDDFWHKLLAGFEITREKIIKKHAKNIKSPRLEILGGIVFGNETINPDETVKEYFRNSGLLHLLAASGLNVALIYGIWYWIASLIKLPYNFSILSGAFFVILYTFMTGFPPSILRASLMLLFVLFGKLIDRNADSISLLFFVGFLILFFNPKMFYDIGFELSFAVTFGLISCVPVIVSKFNNIDKKFKEKYKNKPLFIKHVLFAFSPVNLASIVAVPLVAQLWVVPLQMHYFNELAPFSLFANICVVPFIGILSFIGFVSSIFALIPFLSNPLVFIFDCVANPLLALLIKISALFSSLKFSLITTFGFNVIQIFGFWAVLFLFVMNLRKDFKNKKLFLGFIIVTLFLMGSFIRFDRWKNNLEIIAFDVDNADCFLIKTPKNKYIMIDTGKKAYRGFSSAQTIINNYLRNKRIKQLDLMIITHFDIDHCGGVLDILNSVKANKIYIQKEQGKSIESNAILKYLSDNNLNYSVAKNNEIIYQEPDLKILNYIAKVDLTNNQDKDDNDTSIITLLNYKKKNILFMADAGVRAFYDVKKYLPSKIDILKVGHHGAKETLDDTMLKSLKPDYAIISAGLMFNHPHYSTLNLLYDNNVKVLSTKSYGFLKIILDKKGIRFYHYDCKKGKIKAVLFDRLDGIPFHKNNYIKEFLYMNNDNLSNIFSK